MAKELYLYSPIYSFVAEELVAMMEANAGEDIVLRVNSPGGSVPAGYGIIAKMQERTGKTTIKVDGMAMSMAAFMLLFADNVEALEVASFMLHRAEMYVESEEDKKFLANTNKDLRKRMEARLDSDLLKEYTGYSVADLFEKEQRVDAHLTAKQAKAIGLIDRVTKVDPKEVLAFNAKFYQVAAEADPAKTYTNMTLEKLLAEHPAVYNQILALGKAAGVAEEKDRVEAALTFAEVDLKGVKEAIASGKPLSGKQMAEFALKAMSATNKKNLEEDSPEAGATATGEAAAGGKAGAEAKELTEFVAGIKSQIPGFKS